MFVSIVDVDCFSLEAIYSSNVIFAYCRLISSGVLRLGDGILF